MRLRTLLAGAWVLVSCAIRQEVIPFEPRGATEVCIIENPAVRAGFLREYRSALQGRGYSVRVVPEGSPADVCPVASSYVGLWSYDWFWTSGVYLSLAEIHVFREGRFDAQAAFDTRKAPASLRRIVDAETKIQELVAELFPKLP